MMRLPVALLLLSALFAGCASQTSNPPAIQENLDLIIPGQWHVSAAKDYSLVYFHNEKTEPVSGTWRLTMAGNTDLPEGWVALFSPATATLAPIGSPRTQSGYPDWARSLASLEIPPGQAGTYGMELHFANVTRAFTLTVTEPYGIVSKPNEQVSLTYKGTFHASGEKFDEGAFDTTLGSGQTVPGFDLGLMGLAKNEAVTISIPAAFAYGYDNTDPNYAKFNGQRLDFAVKLTSLSSDRDPVPGDALCAPYNDKRVPGAPEAAGAEDAVQVRFETTMGNFTVETDVESTPATVKNFLQYVDDGFYACTTIHRVAPGFVIQGGGYLSDHQTHKPTRAPIPLEATADKKNLKWTLSMARTGEPNSATSEFFINLADNKNLDATGAGTGYAVFAHVVDGQATVDAITKAKPGRSFGAGGFYPAEPIVIIRAYRL